jgi:hypothetical protein
MISQRRVKLLILAIGGCLLVFGTVMALLNHFNNVPQRAGPDPATRIWNEIIPEAGTTTGYGISLSLDNTQQLIDWHNSIELSTEQQAVRDAALSQLAAPCCDEYPMSTCCCECNLARGVWGLSAYLIAEKGYGADQVREAALQWLHFIRPDYYVASGLEQEGISPGLYGFSTESTCFADHCDRAFYTETSSGHPGGCGGMDELIQAEVN